MPLPQIAKKKPNKTNPPGSAYIGFGQLPTSQDIEIFDAAFVKWQTRRGIIKLKTTKVT